MRDIINNRMEKKVRVSKSKKEVKTPPVAEKTTFAVWFYLQVKAGKLQFWQDKEISVFFKQNGLTEREEADKYSELLKLY